MTEQEQQPEARAPQAPTPTVKSSRGTRISWIWLVPLIAAIVGASLLFRDWLHAGPTIVISFDSAEGLEVGRTRVRYKEVAVGVVTAIKVSPDRTKALVSAQIDRDSSEYIARPGSRFWVVRPRLGLSGVTGLNTLLSGAYISVDTADNGDEDADAIYAFEGLSSPPEVSSARPGTRFTLNAADLGSLEIGSPVYFRRLPVGQVIRYSLEEGGKAVKVQVFVDAPYDRFVTKDARFWNASGVHFSLDAEGFKVETGSLVSVLAGGIAFAPANEEDVEPAVAHSVFRLAPNREQAMADPKGLPLVIYMRFHQSVRGLKVGAPVDFRGMELGKVSAIDLDFDEKERRFFVQVKAELYPRRFGQLYDMAAGLVQAGQRPAARMLAPMIANGLRAQMRSANLLTGQQYVALDFFPKAEPAIVDPDSQRLELPTVAGSFDRLQQQISAIVDKLEKMPLDEIAVELRNSLASLNVALKGVSGDLTPQATSMLRAAEKSLRSVQDLLAKDSAVTTNLNKTMGELSNAAKSLRSLADYLQTHPSSVIRGRKADPGFITP